MSGDDSEGKKGELMHEPPKGVTESSTKKSGLVSGLTARIKAANATAVDRAETYANLTQAERLKSEKHLSETAMDKKIAKTEAEAFEENLPEIKRQAKERLKTRYEAEHKSELAKLQEVVDDADSRLDSTIRERRRSVRRREIEADLKRREEAASPRQQDGRYEDEILDEVEAILAIEEEIDSKILEVQGRNDLPEDSKARRIELLEEQKYERTVRARESFLKKRGQ